MPIKSLLKQIHTKFFSRNNSFKLMKSIRKKEIKELIQSGHINMLLGAGCSSTFISSLGNIERKMDTAIEKNDEKEEIEIKKQYYSLMKKSKAILDDSRLSSTKEKDELKRTKDLYDSFLSLWSQIIAKRYLHIVNKQINIFTTNFDTFIEDSCERLELTYNDGFFGRMNPTFSVGNYNRIQKYKSLQYDNTSDVPIFNLIKLHGSTSWKYSGKDITYSTGDHIIDNLEEKEGNDFHDSYNKIAVINPNSSKHLGTVLDVNYAAMLRKFTLELEKENSVLFIIGFSLADEHIRDLLHSVMESNPTLIVIFFSYAKYDEVADHLEEQKYRNLYIISPKDNFTFEDTIGFISEIFEKTLNINHGESEEDE